MDHLEPLRSGASIVSADELAAIDREWIQWRGEWVRRKKIFNKYVLSGWSGWTLLSWIPVDSSGGELCGSRTGAYRDLETGPGTVANEFLDGLDGLQLLGSGNGRASSSRLGCAGRGPRDRVRHTRARGAGKESAVCSCVGIGQTLSIKTYRTGSKPALPLCMICSTYAFALCATSSLGNPELPSQPKRPVRPTTIWTTRLDLLPRHLNELSSHGHSDHQRRPDDEPVTTARKMVNCGGLEYEQKYTK